MVSASLSDNSGDSAEGRRQGFKPGVRNDEPNFEALPDSVPPQNVEAEEAVLGGILLGIKTRVGQQLIADFKRWCRESPTLMSPQQASEKTAAMQS